MYRDKLLYKCFLFVIIFFWSTPVNGIDWEIKGYFKNSNEWQISEKSSNDLLKCENIFQFEPYCSLGDNIEFHAIFRAFYDAIFDLERGGWTKNFKFKKQIRRARKYSISEPVREFYADIRWKRLFIRLGKQQIAWGEAIGMKMLDLINPQDFRELNQLDFEDSRIPLWTANLIYSPPVMGSYLQLIIIPDIRYDYLPPAGHPFAPQPVNLFQGFIDSGLLHLRNSSTSGPRLPRTFRNIEVGVKWHQNLPTFEYGINYFYHFSDSPGLYKDSPLYNPDLSLNYILKYHRFHTLGGSFTKIFESFLGVEGVVMRGEMAVHLNDRVPHAYTKLFSDANNPFGVKMAKTDSINYLLALEKFFFTDYYTSIQFFQFVRLDYKSTYLDFPTIRDVDFNRMELVASSMDKVDNIFTFYTSTDYSQERVLPDILWVYFDDGALWVRGRCKFKYSDHCWFTAGANLYFGGADTGIGQYHNFDNLFVEIKYDF